MPINSIYNLLLGDKKTLLSRNFTAKLFVEVVGYFELVKKSFSEKVLVSMKLFIALLLLLITQNAQSAAPAIEYQFDHDKTSRKLDVTIKFYGTNSNYSVVQIPDKFWNVDVSEQVGEFKVISSGARIRNIRQNSLVVSHNPSQQIIINYTIRPSKIDNSPYFPKVNSDYTYFIGHAVFLRPTHYNPEESIKIAIENNSGNDFLASMGKFESRNFTLHTSINHLLRSFYFLGEHYKYEFESNGRPVYILFSKDLSSYKANELLEQSPKIIERHRSFFRDNDFPFMLMAYLDFPDFGKVKKVGTRFSTATVLWFSYDDTSNMSEVLQVMAHEHIHNWIGGRIQSRPETHYRDKWFNEGFTEYYSRKLNQYIGIISPEEYIRQYNETIAMYFNTPFRLLSNSEIGENFWKSEQYSKIVYWRGEIIAHILDDKIKQISGGKDNIDTLFAMLMRKAQNGHYFSPELFAEQYYNLTGQKLDINLLNISDSSYLPKRPKLPNGRNYELSERDITYPWCGFSGDKAITSGVIGDMTDNSYASKAGLREGMRVEDIYIPLVRPNANCRAVILHQGRNEKITYPPVHKEIKTPYYYPR
jgi:predicted metalloprotease with PDZ domain